MKSKSRIDAVPEGAQAVVGIAKADLVVRSGLEPETIAITKLEHLEHIGSSGEANRTFAGIGRQSLPDYRIFFLAKGIQYIYETHGGQTPRLAQEKFVL